MENNLNDKNETYSFFDLGKAVVNAVVHASIAGISVLIYVEIWNVYNPQVKCALLAIQNELFRMFI